MKKRILLVATLQLFLTLNSCSSDSGNDLGATPEPPVLVIKPAKVTSYSKNSGETGETVTIYGENFSDKISAIKITFDGVAATIVSTTAAEITFKLPATEKVLPKMVLTVDGKTVNNEVKNNYSGNIGILPARSLTDWIAQERTLERDGSTDNIQMISDKILYLGGVSKTLDGGITWSKWANGTRFYATTNDEGWSSSYGLHNLTKITAGGYLGQETFAKIENTTEDYYCMYVDANMNDGTVVTRNGKVFTTSNGVDFTKVYEIGDNTADLFQSAEIDNDHFWAIGYKTIKNNEGFTDNRPFILFKNNKTDGWKEYPFINEPGGYFAREICFVDLETGFLLVNQYFQTLLDVKLFKTTNGGDSWTPIYNGEKFTKFAFKDANTGWAILENKIYKTTNGGTAWTLDYTHNQPIRNISYKNNVVWAFSTDKILKRYL